MVLNGHVQNSMSTALSPSTESITVGYKEPLRKIEDGFGYLGVLSIDKSGCYVQCHKCGYFFRSLGIHVSKYHNIPSRNYREVYGLSFQTSLSSPNTRIRLLNASRRASTWVKIMRLDILNNGRILSREPIKRQKSLEQKNKEGRCPDQLIDKIQRLNKILGRTPSSREFRQYYHGMLGSICIAYGSWSNALRIAGLTNAKIGTPTRYNKEMLIRLLQDFYMTNKREPSFTDMRNKYMPSQSTFTKYFGSWSGALNEAFNSGETAT